ncbi:MAG: hypothetical protein U1F43_31540 [Myxococcota bacterium]
MKTTSASALRLPPSSTWTWTRCEPAVMAMWMVKVPDESSALSVSSWRAWPSTLKSALRPASGGVTAMARSIWAWPATTALAAGAVKATVNGSEPATSPVLMTVSVPRWSSALQAAAQRSERAMGSVRASMTRLRAARETASS